MRKMQDPQYKTRGVEHNPDEFLLKKRLISITITADDGTPPLLDQGEQKSLIC
jgi:hypothetical protein